MKRKIVVLALTLATAFSLGACNTPAETNAANGAVVGGATGAILGGLITGRPGGALVGAAAGATAGAITGAAATPQEPGYAPPPRACAEWYYDYYGNRVCRSYY
ncbi:MAG: glycine zipper domain-containing protein [Roseiarcus sp.]